MQKPLTQEVLEEKIRTILDSAVWPRPQPKEKLGLEPFEELTKRASAAKATAGPD